MKKLFKLLLVIVFVCAIIYLAPRLIQKCDSCEKWFMGTGYEPNAITAVISDEDQTICRECAETQHAIETTFGKSLDEYRKKLFD